jgi:hypothetical protein
VRTSKHLNIAKVAAAVVIGCVGAAVVPVYGGPFTGCDQIGWLTLSPGCGHWPEALRGFLFVLPIALLAPAKWLLPLFANMLLLCVALVGGAPALQSGEHLYSSAPFSVSFGAGYSVFVGGLLATLPWFASLRARAPRSDGGVA